MVHYKYMIAGVMIQMMDILTPELITDVSGTTKSMVLQELCMLTANTTQVRNYRGFLTAIVNRERLMSTGIGMGVAVPHARTSAVSDMVMAIGRSREGIDFESLDGLPVHIIILIGGPDRRRDDFLGLIAQVGKLFYESNFMERLLEAPTPSDMLTLISERTATPR